MLLNIIIPCYNVEKYIDDCMNSIFMQDADSDDFHVIAINDGSKDETLAKLKEWENKYSNLTVIDQENQGVSVARNRCFDIADAEYIWFIDSDDYILNGSLPIIISDLKKYDPDFVDFENFCSISDNVSFSTQKTVSEMKHRVATAKHIRRFIWCNICKRSIICNKSFVTDVSYSEDMLFAYEVGLKLAENDYNCLQYDTPIYCYRSNPTSALHKKDIATKTKRANDLLYCSKFFKMKLDSGEIKNKGMIKHTKYLKSRYLQSALNVFPESSVEYKELMKTIKSEKLYPYAPLLKDPFKKNPLKNRMINLLQIPFPFIPYYWLFFHIYRRVKK